MGPEGWFDQAGAGLKPCAGRVIVSGATTNQLKESIYKEGLNNVAEITR